MACAGLLASVYVTTKQGPKQASRASTGPKNRPPPPQYAVLYGMVCASTIITNTSPKNKPTCTRHASTGHRAVFLQTARPCAPTPPKKEEAVATSHTSFVCPLFCRACPSALLKFGSNCDRLLQIDHRMRLHSVTQGNVRAPKCMFDAELPVTLPAQKSPEQTPCHVASHATNDDTQQHVGRSTQTTRRIADTNPVLRNVYNVAWLLHTLKHRNHLCARNRVPNTHRLPIQ